jgi:hypothetical protein
MIVANEEGQHARKLRVRHDGSYSRDLKRKKAMVGGLRETWQKPCGWCLAGGQKCVMHATVKEAEGIRCRAPVHVGASRREVEVRSH